MRRIRGCAPSATCRSMPPVRSCASASQIAIGAQAQPRRDPVLIGLDRAALHADGGGLRLEPGDVDTARRDRSLRAPLVDQPVAQQRIERADLQLAQIVGEGLVLVDREIAAADAVAAIGIAAIASERPIDLAVHDRAAIIAGDAAAPLDIEDGVERALGLQRRALRLPDAGKRLDDLRRGSRGAAQQLVHCQRTGLCVRRRRLRRNILRLRRHRTGGGDDCRQQSLCHADQEDEPQPLPGCEFSLPVRSYCKGKSFSCRQIS